MADPIKNPLISIVIPNWNGRKYLETCLNALRRQTYPNVEVILVDNGSDDDSISFLEAHYQDIVKIVKLMENYGFDRGINEGIKVSKGDYIATLNNDTEVDDRWLENIMKGFDKGEDVGMCASKILFYYNRDIIDKAGHLLYRDGLNKGRGCMQKDQGQFDKPEEVFFPDGCAAIYKKKMLDQIGLFEEAFFAYGDDAEIGFRARLFGWKCIYAPDAVVYHIHSGSTTAYSKLKVFLVERNRFWLAIKLFPLPFLIVMPYYTIARFFWHAYTVLFSIGSAGSFKNEHSGHELLFVLIKAYLSGIKGLPYILKRRREIQKKITVDNKQINEWFSKFGISAKDIAFIK